MNPIPFLSREQFAETVPTPLFPIHDYDICKKMWETSPLILTLCEALAELPAFPDPIPATPPHQI